MSASDFPDPLKLISTLASTYAECSTYKDNGIVETTIQPGTAAATSRQVWFTTYFRRPNYFRFAFLSRTVQDAPTSDSLSVIWSDGKRTYSKLPYIFWNPESDLNSAITGTIGVTHEASHRIPALLMPHLVKQLPPNETKRIGVDCIESLDEESCYRVHHELEQDEVQREYWVSQSRSLLLKVREQMVLGTNTAKAFSTEGGPSTLLSNFLVWGMEALSSSVAKNPNPTPIVNETIYRNVTLNEPIPDSAFTEQGR
ncbi:MAG TPA: hypothetical protein V6C97_31380 [Oculatellaceae cyanobacterium]